MVVLVKNVESERGNLMVQVLNEEEVPVASKIFPVRGKNEENLVKLRLPSGPYAVRVFHDINANGELDKNLMGMPTEPYGFSNDARATFGSPKLEDQLVLLDRDQKISIRLK